MCLKLKNTAWSSNLAYFVNRHENVNLWLRRVLLIQAVYSVLGDDLKIHQKKIKNQTTTQHQRQTTPSYHQQNTKCRSIESRI